MSLLRRLDAHLARVCVAEEARAARLAGDRASGWQRVLDLLRPSIEELTLDEVSILQRSYPFLLTGLLITLVLPVCLTDWLPLTEYGTSSSSST